jgi:hypothetical protein
MLSADGAALPWGTPGRVGDTLIMYIQKHLPTPKTSGRYMGCRPLFDWFSSRHTENMSSLSTTNVYYGLIHLKDVDVAGCSMSAAVMEFLPKHSDSQFLLEYLC